MQKNQFTFNDLPEVLGKLCDRIESMNYNKKIEYG